MAGKKLQLDVDIATKQAQKNLKDAAAQAKKLGDELDDTESAGKKMARALNAVADDIDQEFTRAQAAAEKLGNALGPEFAADAERGEMAIMEIVANLRAAGLAYDDIEADAEELAVAIKRLDQTGSNLDGLKNGADNIEAGFRRVGAEADNTRSVVANFTGNAVQELPMLADAIGPLNMAIGQFGEYAAEGNIRLKNFIAAGAGLAVVSLAVSAIGDYFAGIAKSKAFNKDRVQTFTAALREAGDEAENLADAMSPDQTISWDSGTGSIIDMTAALARAGVSAGEFFQIIEGGRPAIDEWKASALAASDGSADWGKLVDAIAATMVQNMDAVSAAEARAAAEAFVYGEEIEETGDKTAGAAKQIKDLKSGIDRLHDALDDRSAFDTWIQAQNEAKWAAVEAWKAAEEGAEDASDKQAAYQSAVRESIDASLQYLETLGGIPESKVTAISALIDEGSFAEAERQLAIITRNRQMVVSIEAKGGAGVFQRIGKNGAPVVGATGGIVTRPTVALIGEAGPEAVVPLNRTPGSSPLPTGTAGVTNNITINMPAGSNGDDVVRAIRRYERVNGAGWRG